MTNSDRDPIDITLRDWIFRAHQCLISVLDGNQHLFFPHSGLRLWTTTNATGSRNRETSAIFLHETDNSPSCGTKQIEGFLVGGRPGPIFEEHAYGGMTEYRSVLYCPMHQEDDGTVSADCRNIILLITTLSLDRLQQIALASMRCGGDALTHTHLQIYLGIYTGRLACENCFIIHNY